MKTNTRIEQLELANKELDQTLAEIRLLAQKNQKAIFVITPISKVLKKFAGWLGF